MIGRIFPVEIIIYNNGKSTYVEKNAKASCVFDILYWYTLLENVGGGM